MRLAFVIHDLDLNNGQGRYVVELARRFQRRASVEIYSNTADPAVLADLPYVRWVRVRAWNRRYIFRIFTFIAAAESRLALAAPDLVHAQGLSCWCADVITVHIVNRARMRHLPACDSRSRRFAAILSPVEGLFYRWNCARRAVVMSRRLGAELRAEYGWTKEVVVIPHGTDVSRFRPPTKVERAELKAARGFSDRDWVWLYIGEAAKGLDLVIGRLPEFPRARLLVVSRSPSTGPAALAASLGVAGRVVFAGFDPRPELVYRTADLLVHPASYEAFGMVVTEAMASGLPVIVGAAVGAAELMTDGVDGLLVDPGLAGQLTEALHQLDGNPVLWETLGVAARARIVRQDWDVCANDTWRVYEGI
jgi:UDP-glucose:(heptosyl)LPS alpha-1,3-glucosyltransferase